MIWNYLLVWLFSIFACFIASAVAVEAIIGGYKAAFNQFNYQVSLQKHGEHFCGGGIIGKKFILTAAHCTIGHHGVLKSPNTSITVVAATKDLRKIGLGTVICQVHEVYSLVEFEPALVNTADISVLKLYDQLPLGSHGLLASVLLPLNKTNTYENRTALISGYGWTWISYVNGKVLGGGANDSLLHWAEAKVLARSDLCYFKRAMNAEKQICAGLEQYGRQTRSVCAGDGGSPLVHLGTVIGILSTGPVSCSEKIFGATYTRVTQYLQFIRNAKSNKVTRNMRKFILPRYSLELPPDENSA